MTTTLWNYIYSFKEFICLSAICVIGILVYLTYQTNKIKYPSKVPTMSYLLFQANTKIIFLLVFSLLQITFVVSSVLFQKNIEDVFVVFFGVLSILIIFITPKFIQVIYEVISSILLLTGLITQNIIFRYLQEIRLEIPILIIYILLNFFLILFVIYLLVHRLNSKLRVSKKKGTLSYENI